MSSTAQRRYPGRKARTIRPRQTRCRRRRAILDQSHDTVLRAGSAQDFHQKLCAKGKQSLVLPALRKTPALLPPFSSRLISFDRLLTSIPPWSSGRIFVCARMRRGCAFFSLVAQQRAFDGHSSLCAEGFAKQFRATHIQDRLIPPAQHSAPFGHPQIALVIRLIPAG